MKMETFLTREKSNYMFNIYTYLLGKKLFILYISRLIYIYISLD